MRSFNSIFLVGAVAADCQTGDFCVTSCNDATRNNLSAMTISVDRDYMEAHHNALSGTFDFDGNDYTKTIDGSALTLNMTNSDYIFLEYELETAQVDVAGTTDIYFAGRTTTFKCRYPRLVNVNGNYTVTDDPDPSPYVHDGVIQYDFTSSVANGRTEVVIAKQHGIPGLEANVQNCAISYDNLPNQTIYPVRFQEALPYLDSEVCIDSRIETSFTYANGGATVDWRTFHFNDPSGTPTTQQHDITCEVHVSDTLTVSAPANCNCYSQASCELSYHRANRQEGQCTEDGHGTSRSSPDHRTLGGLTTTARDYRNGDMTVEDCIAHCKGENFAYAGIQVGRECFCGNDYPPVLAPASDCSFMCEGNFDQVCGGGWRNSVYSTARNVWHGDTQIASYTSEGGVNANRPIGNAFDDSDTSIWHSSTPFSVTPKVKIEFQNPIDFDRLVIKKRVDTHNRGTLYQERYKNVCLLLDDVEISCTSATYGDGPGEATEETITWAANVQGVEKVTLQFNHPTDPAQIADLKVYYYDSL